MDTLQSKRLEELEDARLRLSRLVQAYEREFGPSSYLNRAPTLENQFQLDEADLLVDRYALLSKLPKGGHVVEVGVDRGDFSLKILNEAQPKSLTLIDIDLSRLRDDNRDFLEANRAVRMIEGDSSTVLGNLTGMYDWIYIDAHHGYDFVKKDIASSHQLVKPGGYLVFNDYTLWSAANMGNYGVSRAVNEFLNSNQEWRVAYFAFQGGGYHDLAARKRGPVRGG